MRAAAAVQHVVAALTALALALTLTLAAQAARAQPPRDLQPQVPALTARVNDRAGVLRDDEARALEERLASYERETGHQFAVLTLDSLGGQSLEDFSIRTAEQWRLGDARRSDGLLVVVAVRDRAVRVEVGYGLEGAVPDVVAHRVIDDAMAPRFAAGDFAGGLEAGLDALMKAARGESVGPQVPQVGAPAIALLEHPLVIAALVIVAVIVFMLLPPGARWFLLGMFLGGGGRRRGSRGGGGGGIFRGGGGGHFGGGGASGRF